MSGMPEEWMVRVADKEYGPVDLAALREWKTEGRLIAENEIRRVGDTTWVRAGAVLEIFSNPEAPRLESGAAPESRTWPQILAETFSIYRRGLGRFLLFGLLSAIPMFALQWTLPKLPIPDLSSGGAAITWPTLSPISIALVVLVLIMWPISTAGFQFVADDILKGHARPFASQFRAALARWSQVLAAGLMVYGSYLFWFIMPFTILLSLASSGQLSLLNTFLFLLISTFMVYMNARLFINFLFWHQTSALRPDGALSALRESKELARSVPTAPKLDRPLYRGAIVASVWLLIILVFSFAIQLPFIVARFVGATNPEEAVALAKAAAAATTPDTLTILADLASAAVNLFMQPLLAAAFIVLYYDARARAGKRDEDEIS